MRFQVSWCGQCCQVCRGWWWCIRGAQLTRRFNTNPDLTFALTQICFVDNNASQCRCGFGQFMKFFCQGGFGSFFERNVPWWWWRRWRGGWFHAGEHMVRGKVTEYNNKRKSVHSSCNRINSEAGGPWTRHGGLDGGGWSLLVGIPLELFG